MCLISGSGWFFTGRKQERVRHPRSTSPQGEPTSSIEHPAVKGLHVHTGSVQAVRADRLLQGALQGKNLAGAEPIED